MSAYGQRLIVVAVLAVLDIANYFFGIDHLGGLRNEQIIGTILTVLLAIAGIVPGLGLARAVAVKPGLPRV